MMKLFKVFLHDLRAQFSKPIPALTFIAVAVMPILYSGFLIMGNWDPYGQLQELPVAVVNLDRGAEYEGEPVTAGRDFIEELKDDETFNWKFVSPEEAERGMAANEYYAMITVPEDFSARVISVSTDDPQQAELIYEANGYSNFIAAQISQNATRELKSELSAKISEAYSRSIIERFTRLSDGLREASDGAGKLADGSAELADGIGKVRGNLASLATGAGELADGAAQLRDGAGTLADAASAVSDGGSRLAEGVGQLASAAAVLEEGAGKLAQNAGALDDGIASAASGAASLTAGLEQLAAGTGRLNEGIASAAAASGQIADGSAQLAAQLQQLLESDAALGSSASLQALVEASRKLADSAAQLSEAQRQLQSSGEQLAAGQAEALQGARQVSSGLEQLRQGFAAFRDGQQELYDGIRQMNSKLPELAAGGTGLAQGARQLGEGAGKLKANIAALADGAGRLRGGASELADGAAALDSGAGELVSGSAELRDKLSEAADKTNTLQGDDTLAELLSNPVAMVENDARKVSHYGSGIAPYFLSLAFFAGALIYSNTFPIRRSYDPNARGFSLFFGKVLAYGLMGVIQALIVGTVVVYALGLQVANVPMFYLYTAIVSLTFMFLVQMLTTWLERPGQFIALMLLILQLVSSAGTFPYELLPGWAQALHPWMPMSYSVAGYRDVISVGSFGDMWTQAGKLLLILIASIILIGVFYAIASRRKNGAPDAPSVPASQH